MNLTNTQFLLEYALAAACFAAAATVVLAIYEREKHWQAKIAEHQQLRRKEDLYWPTRHAARWLCVAMLLVTGAHHLQTESAWWRRVTLQDGDNILPDVLMVVFGFAYALSVFCPRWFAKYVARKNSAPTQ